jgi:hypothetical protein
MVDPPISYVTVGKSFTVNIDVSDVVNLTSWEFKLYYDNTVLTCDNAIEGPFLQTGGGTYFGMAINNTYSSTQGYVLVYDTLEGSAFVGGSGVLATITFYALADGDTSLHLSDTKLGDTAIPPNPIDHQDIDGTVYVQSFTLTVNVVGTGCSVTLSDTGPYYHYGETVQLTAVPAPGYSFSGFTGDLVSATSPASITITGDMSVTATFGLIPYTLTISYAGDGSGSVSTDESAPYYYGEVVTLTASPNAGSSFSGFTGDLVSATSPASITITGDMSVTATFALIPYTLTINYAGSGTVSTDKSAPYYYGEVVTLTATPASGWSFQYWGGDLSGSANVTTITMNADHSVTANFVNKPTLQMSPTSKTCRVYHENFTVTISVSTAANIQGYTFEIDYNTAQLDYVSVTWNLWGNTQATITPDEADGKITVSNSGTPVSGTQTLVTINFTVSLHSILKWNGIDWTGNLTSTIYFESISISYPTGPNLNYQRGDQTQISVGPDFAYTFFPIQGDVNNDGVVDVFDLRTVAAYFNVKAGDSNWAAASAYDLGNYGQITVGDIYIVTQNFDYHYVP